MPLSPSETVCVLGFTVTVAPKPERYKKKYVYRQGFPHAEQNPNRVLNVIHEYLIRLKP